MSNGNRPVEEEFRSSQIYKALKDSGIPVADKIAQGLGKAAESIDGALSGMASATGQTAKQQARYDRYAKKQARYAWQQQVKQATQQAKYAQQQAKYAGQAPQQTPGPGRPQTGGPQTGGSQPVGPQAGGYTYRYTVNTGGQQQAPNAGQTQNHAGQRSQKVTPVPPPQMKLVRKRGPARFYITGAAALLYALSMPLYEPAHFIVFALVLCGVFLASGALFKGKKQWVPIEEPKPKPKEEPKKQEPEKKSATGNPEVDKLIDEGSEYLKKLRAANDAIPDEALSEDIERMEKASADIFRYIADHPEKAPQIRKFMNYYLPTTLKLLNSYQRLAGQSVRGENITSTMFNIAGMMHTVANAFEKQLDSLFTDEAMDISADISVFETLLKQEGFVEENQTAQK